MTSSVWNQLFGSTKGKSWYYDVADFVAKCHIMYNNMFDNEGDMQKIPLNSIFDQAFNCHWL